MGHRRRALTSDCDGETQGYGRKAKLDQPSANGKRRSADGPHEHADEAGHAATKSDGSRRVLNQVSRHGPGPQPKIRQKDTDRKIFLSVIFLSKTAFPKFTKRAGNRSRPGVDGETLQASRPQSEVRLS